MHTNQTNNPVEFFPKNGVIYITLSGDVLTYNVERDLQKIDEQVQAYARWLEGLGQFFGFAGL